MRCRMLNEKEAKRNAYYDLINRYKYAKIETDINDGEIVNIKIIQNIKLSKEYLKKEGYLK